MSNEEQSDGEPHSPGSEDINGVEDSSLTNSAHRYFKTHFMNHVALTGEEYEHVLRIATTLILPSITPAEWACRTEIDSSAFDAMGLFPAVLRFPKAEATFDSPPAGLSDSEAPSSFSFEEDVLPNPSGLIHFQTRETEPDEADYPYVEGDVLPNPSNQIHFQTRETKTDAADYPFVEEEVPPACGRLGIFVLFDKEDEE
ncbi:hypothetical protein [Rhodococcus qingshengii]|uniref:hypothetical protein n=1 Tax=Rhodococcus qingshengii TaxID=334542 RepID=UPI001BA9AE14|nr:hypothetical protein [Rhodococcus qingshengii]MBS3690825.1 hypothetical protein [Rhodococcus qingshengii]